MRIIQKVRMTFYRKCDTILNLKENAYPENNQLVKNMLQRLTTLFVAEAELMDSAIIIVMNATKNTCFICNLLITKMM